MEERSARLLLLVQAYVEAEGFICFAAIRVFLPNTALHVDTFSSSIYAMRPGRPLIGCATN